MSMDKVFGIAGSALAAQLVRMNTTASNLANASNTAATAGRLRDDECDRLRSLGKHGAKPPLGTQALSVREKENLIALRDAES